jgi:hypothetical protein
MPVRAKRAGERARVTAIIFRPRHAEAVAEAVYLLKGCD